MSSQMCAAGRAFGLHSGDGRQLWSLSYPPTVRLAHAALWRTSHDTSTPPQVLLLGSTQDDHTFFSVLDAHHGLQTSEGILPYPVTQVGLRPSRLYFQSKQDGRTIFSVLEPLARMRSILPCSVSGAGILL